MKKYCLILALLIAASMQSQENKMADSLMQALAQTSNAEAKASLLTEIAETYGVDSKKGLLWYKKGAAHALQNKIDPSNYTDAIGIHHLNKQEYDIALNYFLKAIEQAKRFANKHQEAASYDHISIIFDEQDHLDKSMHYLKKSMAINSAINDSIGLADNYLSLGIIHSKMGKQQESVADFNKALKIYKVKALTERIASTYFNLGFVTEDHVGRYNYYVKSQELWDASDPKYPLAVSNLCNLAETCLILSRNAKLSSQVNSSPKELLSKAERAVEKAILYSKEDNVLYNLMYAYEVMAKISEANNNPKTALYYTRQQYTIKDSLFSQEVKNKIAAVESEREIALKDKEIQVNKLTLETQKKQLLYLFTGILLFTVIVVLLFMQNSIRKKNNIRLQKLNDELDHANTIKNRLFSIINHDLRSPVASLINFLHLQKENVLDDKKKQELETKALASAENLLESMEDLLLWSKGQMKNFTPEIKPVAAKYLFEDINNFYAATTLASMQFLDNDNTVFKTDVNYLKTIMRNLTVNAFKAVAGTAEPKIEWRAWQENDHAFLSVSDNGPGTGTEAFDALYDEKKAVGIKSGLGLHLIRELAKAIDCTITVISTPGYGTVITLEL